MKAIGFLLVWIGSLICANAQLRFKGSEKNNAYGARTTLNETTGEILPENLIPADEKIIYSVDNNLYAAKKIANKYIIKKYEVIKGGAYEVNLLESASVSKVSFFKNGAFVVMESDEGFGKNIKSFSNDFQLLQTFTPFLTGYDGILFNNSQDVIVIGINPNGFLENPKLIAIHSSGKILFEKELKSEIRISEIISSNLFIGITTINRTTNVLEMTVYNNLGIELWSKKIDEMSKKWFFNHSPEPTLITGTRAYLNVINALNGNIIAQKKLTEIYDDSNVKRTRKDGFIEIVEITSFRRATSSGFAVRTYQHY